MQQTKKNTKSFFLSSLNYKKIGLHFLVLLWFSYAPPKSECVLFFALVFVFISRIIILIRLVRQTR
jgi:hypothetical protein